MMYPKRVHGSADIWCPALLHIKDDMLSHGGDFQEPAGLVVK